MRSQHEIQPKGASVNCGDAAIRSGRPSGVPEQAALVSRHFDAFGRNCRRARIEAELTLDDVAAVSGISRTCLSAIEAGQCDPRLSTMTAIALVFGGELWRFL